MEYVKLNKKTNLPIPIAKKLWFYFSPYGKPVIKMREHCGDYPNAITGEEIVSFNVLVEKDDMERYVIKNAGI